jgi:RNA polymerase sigma-70 factor (ECF subfamily)
MARRESFDPDAEAAILQKVLAGNTGAYGVIFLRHRQRAFALAYQYVRDYEDAKDIVQEAFIRAFQNLKKFDLRKRFAPWLLTIVRNLAVDHLRKRKPLGPAIETELLIDQRAAQRTESHLLAAEVWAALNRLSEAHKEIIFLKDYQGHSYLEIAEILDIPVGTVMSRLHHARRNLMAALQDRNDEM